MPVNISELKASNLYSICYMQFEPLSSGVFWNTKLYSQRVKEAFVSSILSYKSIHTEKINACITDHMMELSFYNVKCSNFNHLFSVFQKYLFDELKKYFFSPLMVTSSKG